MKKKVLVGAVATAVAGSGVLPTTVGADVATSEVHDGRGTRQRTVVTYETQICSGVTHYKMRNVAVRWFRTTEEADVDSAAALYGRVFTLQCNGTFDGQHTGGGAFDPTFGTHGSSWNATRTYSWDTGFPFVRATEMAAMGFWVESAAQFKNQSNKRLCNGNYLIGSLPC